MKTSNDKANPFFPRAAGPRLPAQAGLRESSTVKKWMSIVGIAVTLAFSFYLMLHTFSYDRTRHELQIASKAWSDFGAHIPLIRSFSYGPNFSRLFSGQPVESPLFPGEPIRYHFGFYALVGILERAGLPIDLALNIPSALGLTLLVCAIYLTALRFFKERGVAFFSVVFFLFNGSLSFLQFFYTHPLNSDTLTDIMTNDRFPAFGPWDGSTISAFWNLNIYTNQRHLALSYGLVLLNILLLVFPHKRIAKHPLVRAMILSATTSILLFIHYPAALIFAVFALSIFFNTPETRKPLILAGLLSLPAMILLSRISNTSANIIWQPGYLSRSVTIPAMLSYWFENIGLHFLFIPLGLILAPKNIRKIFLGPVLVLFILPNLFRFSPDMINNHKFLNFFLIIGNMFSAYAVTRILKRFDNIPMRQLRKPLQWIVGTGLIIILTLSGIIDLFAVINDTKGTVPDVHSDPDTAYILNKTDLYAVIANSTWLYHPASIAGRAIFSGYTYFTWSYGYNQGGRESEQTALYQSPDLSMLCNRLKSEGIAAVELNERPEQYLSPNMDLWNNLIPDYENPQSGRRIYITEHICRI